jgi:hypothetical protein
MALDPSDERGVRRFVAHAKSNVSELAPTQTFDIEAILLPALNGYPESRTARLQFKGLSELGPADLLGPRPTAEEKSELDEATAFLIAELSSGPVKVRDLTNAARAAGISERTLKRARGELGCKAVRVLTHWEVKLPDEATRGWAPDLYSNSPAVSAQQSLEDDDEPF